MACPITDLDIWFIIGIVLTSAFVWCLCLGFYGDVFVPNDMEDYDMDDNNHIRTRATRVCSFCIMSTTVMTILVWSLAVLAVSIMALARVGTMPSREVVAACILVVFLVVIRTRACDVADLSACGAEFNQGYCNATLSECCNATLSECICNPGWMGINCTQCDPLSPLACSSGLGACFNSSANATVAPDYHCVCDGRTQPNCSTPTCYRQEYEHPREINACSGGGPFDPRCNTADNTCTCDSAGGDPFQVGAWCQTPVHQCHEGIEPTPVNCSGVIGSQCLRDGSSDGHYCVCDGYEQPTCNQRTCGIERYPLVPPTFGLTCGGHGACLNPTGICACDPPYASPWCENRTCTNNTQVCNNVPSAVCVFDGEGGSVCDCAGFTWPFCANRTCKIQRFGHETPDVVDCGGHGSCNTTSTRCVCDPPFEGPWCEDNPFGCNPVGTINVTNGTCIPKPGYGGQYACQLDYSQPFPHICPECNFGGLCNCTTTCGATSFCNPLNGTCNCFDDLAGLRVPPSCCLGGAGWESGVNGTYREFVACGGHGTCTNTIFPYDGECVCFDHYDTLVLSGSCENGPCGIVPIFGPTPFNNTRCADASGQAYCDVDGLCINCPIGKRSVPFNEFQDVAPGRCCPFGLVWLNGVVVNGTCGVSDGHASCIPDGTCFCESNGHYIPGGPVCTEGPCDGRNATQCNGHGVCGAGQVCACLLVNDTMWDGFDCNHNICEDPFLYPFDGHLRRGVGCCLGSFSWINGTRLFRACGGHGICDPDTHTCTCDTGYSGEECAVGPCGDTPTQCHGHGICNSTSCTCDDVSYGPQCNTNIYCGLYDRPCNGFTDPQFEDPFFASRGVCNGTYGCICTSVYYTGQICETITGCNVDRTIRYNKTTGHCDCIPGLGFGTACCASNCTLGCGGTGSGPDCACPHVDNDGFGILTECRGCDRLTGQCFCPRDLDAALGLCCPRALNLVTNNITDICGGRGTCNGYSSCACNHGFEGQFCCIDGCNGNGICRKVPTTRAAFCDCFAGSTGVACQLHPGCPSVNMIPCSGRGMCASVSGVDYAHLLGYINQPNGNRNMDLLWGNLTRLYLGASEALPSQYLPIQDGTYLPGTDFSYNIIYAFANDERLSDRIRLFRSMPNGIHDWVFGIQTTLLADLGTPATSYMNIVIGLINVTDDNFGPGANNRVTAILDQMLYGMRLDFDTGVTHPFTSPAASFECLCNATSTSTSCADACPLSPLNGRPCTGLYFGDFHGACRYSTNLCVCGSRYLGSACDVYRGEGCFKTNTTTEVCEGRGICNQVAGDVYACHCNPGSTGAHCDEYLCSENAPTLIERQTQCHNLGICGADGNCTCNIVQGHDPLSPPVLPVGQDCQFNAIRECGTFTAGSWLECDGHGTCRNDSFHASPYCRCNNGYRGQYCNITICPAPGCNARETCDESVGVCRCLETWETPTGSCTNNSISCRCLHSKCGHGVANQAQDACICNQFYRKDNTGSCTIVQCPLVLVTDSGERACNLTAGSGDRICDADESSHASVCCYDACVSGSGVSLCTFPTPSQLIPNCSCDPSIAFNQLSGVCHSKCHGHPYTQIGNTVVCQCTASYFLFPRFNATNEFMTLTDCSRRTCLHGGVVSSNGQSCNCVNGYRGTLCATPPSSSSTQSSSSSSSTGSTASSTHSSSTHSSSSTGSQSASSSSHSSSSGSSSTRSSSSSSSASPSTASSLSSSSTGSSSSSSTAATVPAAASSSFWTPGIIAGVTVAAVTAAAGLAVGIYFATLPAAPPGSTGARARFFRTRRRYITVS